MNCENVVRNFDLLENQNEKLGKISRIMGYFSFLIIPLIIQIILIGKMKSNQKKQSDLICYYVLEEDVKDIYVLLNIFTATFVYKSLNDLMKTKLIDYKLSDDMTHIIKKTESNYECDLNHEQKYNYYQNFYINILNEICRVGTDNVSLTLFNARIGLERDLIAYTLNSDECVDLQYFVDWYNGLIVYNLKRVGYLLAHKMTIEKALKTIENYKEAGLIKIEVDSDNNLVR